jgi:hypothetical protein
VKTDIKARSFIESRMAMLRFSTTSLVVIMGAHWTACSAGEDAVTSRTATRSIAFLCSSNTVLSYLGILLAALDRWVCKEDA